VSRDARSGRRQSVKRDLLPLDRPSGACYNASETMKWDDKRSGGKPPSLNLRLDFVEEDLDRGLDFITKLCEALLVGDENVRRVKTLAVIAMWSAGRRPSDGE